MYNNKLLFEFEYFNIQNNMRACCIVFIINMYCFISKMYWHVPTQCLFHKHIRDRTLNILQYNLKSSITTIFSPTMYNNI